MQDYKGVFQEFYDEAKEQGMSDDDAGEFATDSLTNWYASLVDSAMDSMDIMGSNGETK